MKSLLSFAFLVTLYVVFTHINCDINSNYSKSATYQNALRDRTISKKNHTDNIHQHPINTPLTLLPPFNITHFDVLANNDTTLLDFEDVLLDNESRGKLCLLNVSQCIEKDVLYESTTDHLSKFLFNALPPFDLSLVDGVSPPCQQESRQYVNALEKFHLWALKIYDSSAKLPSGFLNGNVNQLGDFDLCLQASSTTNNVHGEYCLASMQVEVPQSPYLSGLHRLVHSHSHFRSQLEDPGHRVPRFSSIKWALCVPSACTSKDVALGLKQTLDNIVRNTELKVRSRIEPGMCQSGEKVKSIPTSTLIVSSLFVGIILLAVYATLYDHYDILEEKNQWITAFSLKKNITSMITIKKSSDDIEVLHGVRFLNSALLILAHKSMATFFAPYMNRTEMAEYYGQTWTVIGRAASLYTDPFIMISGTLTTYSLLGKLQRANKINIGEEYISRLFRILPTFAALILFCTFVLPWLGSGPMWPLVITHHSTICQKYWWRNLLFIHNYFGFNDMCLTHTHHIGIDTQLFFTSPFLVLLLWKWPRNGSFVLIVLATISTIMRYYVTYTMRLSNYVHYGTSIKQLFATADNMYILPAHRATVYIIGILLGYALKNFRNISLSQTQLRLGNAIALLCFLSSFFGPAFMSSIDYVYNPLHAAWYAAYAPILWCISFGWIIFTSHTGHKGLLGHFFCWPQFSLWSKISYTVYLTQFPVFFYNIGTTRNSDHFAFFRIMANAKEYGWIIGLSIILTLLIEYPFQNIRNTIFKYKESKKTESVAQKKIR